MQRKRVREEFNRAASYASEYEGDTPIAHFFNTRLRRVNEMLSEFQEGRVLDVGCGPAKVAHQFRGKSIDYHGVDVSEAMLEECRKAFGESSAFHFTLGNMEALDFPNSHFDVALCLGALEYALDGHAAIKELARVTKVGGMVIATMHNPFSPYRIWLNYGYTKLYNVARRLRLVRVNDENKLAQPHVRPAFHIYTARELRECFEQAGLHVEDVVYYDFNVFFSPLDTLMPRASATVSRKFELLGRSPLKWIGSGYILKGRKSAAR